MKQLFVPSLLLALLIQPAPEEPTERLPRPFETSAADRGALELHGGRFLVEVEWHDFQGRAGKGEVARAALDPSRSGHSVDPALRQPVPLRSQDSAVLSFFQPRNWEVLVKVLDGRELNGRFWVFLAAATDLGFFATVADTRCGRTRTYINPLGRPARAMADVEAFDSCAEPLPARCTEQDGVLCLGEDGRFRVEITWSDYMKNRGSGRQATIPAGLDARSRDSGLLYFFHPDNWEVLIKVLDGCAHNGHFWVFGAVTSNLEYRLTVTDRTTGQVRTYANPLGNSALAINDTRAFPACDSG